MEKPIDQQIEDFLVKKSELDIKVLAAVSVALNKLEVDIDNLLDMRDFVNTSVNVDSLISKLQDLKYTNPPK